MHTHALSGGFGFVFFLEEEMTSRSNWLYTSCFGDKAALTCSY